ncbi:hypothetical protein RBSH_04171 [Rhodopirellula baltica SH28]|uniref:Uncharacterized protein n=1 Tax=Rhodopirellula baltica SH28 TaxID=993517 RepID=K5DC94_RHOBT|nr:hypothetical protein RBSH_04171 [Rhodopirellula baltica SH28]
MQQHVRGVLPESETWCDVQHQGNYRGTKQHRPSGVMRRSSTIAEQFANHFRSPPWRADRWTPNET